jgi:hypothetical protein
MYTVMVHGNGTWYMVHGNHTCHMHGVDVDVRYMVIVHGICSRGGDTENGNSIGDGYRTRKGGSSEMGLWVTCQEGKRKRAMGGVRVWVYGIWYIEKRKK